MGSMQWTDEEADYIRAIFKWQERLDGFRNSAALSRLSRLEIPNDYPEDIKEKETPAGEFRILVVGAKACGKTSILTRFCTDTFHDDPDSADACLEGGCRRRVDIDGLTYTVDVLELPHRHLSTDLMLEQALVITEGAVIVYDIADWDSLQVATRVQRFIRDSTKGDTGNGGREYGLLLVGNKSDIDDEDRMVPWAEGSRTASSFEMSCGFMEVSAKTGDNVSAIFPALGEEILKLKLLARQRREEAEMEALLKITSQTGTGSSRKRGLWKSLTHPFSRRRDGQLRA